MQRSSRNNAICFKSLEQALEECPETYRHLDLIAFGFPCQDISNANPKGKGLKGERSSIFFECMRIVNILQPSWILIENVPRLLSINNGRDMATVLQTMAKSGYWWAYRILDSQYFGVAQRRKRVFIVGSFGNTSASEILLESQSSSGNDKKVKKMGQRGLCISAKCGERQDPTSDTFIAERIRKGVHSCVRAGGEPGNRLQGYVAQTLGATPRGNTSFVWQDTYIAETNTNREREVARIPSRMD